MANAKKLPLPIDPKNTPITLHSLTGKLDYLFNNVKELVESTARRTENVLRKEMQGMGKRLDEKIDGVGKRLDEKIDGVGKRLDEKIDGVEKRLDEKIDGVEKRLDEKIGGVEKRLDEKIGGVEKRLIHVEADVKEIKTTVKQLDEKFSEKIDNHEARITNLETVHP